VGVGGVLRAEQAAAQRQAPLRSATAAAQRRAHCRWPPRAAQRTWSKVAPRLDSDRLKKTPYWRMSRAQSSSAALPCVAMASTKARSPAKAKAGPA
jgi:hypothetical protein